MTEQARTDRIRRPLGVIAARTPGRPQYHIRSPREISTRRCMGDGRSAECLRRVAAVHGVREQTEQLPPVTIAMRNPYIDTDCCYTWWSPLCSTWGSSATVRTTYPSGAFVTQPQNCCPTVAASPVGSARPATRFREAAGPDCSEVLPTRNCVMMCIGREGDTPRIWRDLARPLLCRGRPAIRYGRTRQSLIPEAARAGRCR